jgi:hypothetical protein
MCEGILKKKNLIIMNNTKLLNININQFNGVIMKNGFSKKYKNILLYIFYKINFFIYNNKKYLYSNFGNIN